MLTEELTWNIVEALFSIARSHRFAQPQWQSSRPAMSMHQLLCAASWVALAVCDGLPGRGLRSTQWHGALQVDHWIKREETLTENQAREVIDKVGLLRNYRFWMALLMSVTRSLFGSVALWIYHSHQSTATVPLRPWNKKATNNRITELRSF